SLALGTLQMVGAGYAEEARSAAVPSLLPLPGFGHNDVPAPSFHAWNRFDRVHGFVVGSMTCLAVMAAQSFARTGRGFPAGARGVRVAGARGVPAGGRAAVGGGGVGPVGAAVGWWDSVVGAGRG